MGVPHKNKHLISPKETCVGPLRQMVFVSYPFTLFWHVPFMLRSSKVKQFLNPMSKNTDQLGLCGVTYTVTPLFPTDTARQIRTIPEVE